LKAQVSERAGMFLIKLGASQIRDYFFGLIRSTLNFWQILEKEMTPASGTAPHWIESSIFPNFNL
jgi:hypothetical protein